MQHSKLLMVPDYQSERFWNYLFFEFTQKEDQIEDFLK